MLLTLVLLASLALCLRVDGATSGRPAARMQLAGNGSRSLIDEGHPLAQADPMPWFYPLILAILLVLFLLVILLIILWAHGPLKLPQRHPNWHPIDHFDPYVTYE